MGDPLPVHKAVVSASIGLHARPAAMFVRAVNETGLPVTIRRAGIQGVDARSLLEVMTADFPYGCEVELSVPDGALSGSVTHRGAEDALLMLAELLQSQGAS
jgi:phosphocarrier protein HPr